MRYVIATLVAALIVAGLESYARHVSVTVQAWLAMPRVLSLGERLAMFFSSFWLGFHWLLAPMIMLACLVLAAIYGERPKAARAQSGSK